MDLETVLDIHDIYITEAFGDNSLIVNYTSDLLSKTEKIQCIIYKDYFIYGKELVETIEEYHCEIGDSFLDFINLDINALNSLYDAMCSVEIGKDFTFHDLFLLFPDKGYPNYQDIINLPKRQLKKMFDIEISTNVYKNYKKFFQLILNIHPYFWEHISFISEIRSIFSTKIGDDKNPLNIVVGYETILMFLVSFKKQIRNVIRYRNAVDFMLCLNTNEHLHSLPFIKRQYLYLAANDICDEDIISNFSPKKDYDFLIRHSNTSSVFDKKDDLLNKIKDLNINPISYISISGDFQNVCSESINILIEINKGVKRCNYCSKYFFIKGNYETNYCDRVFPGTNRTCQQLASIEKYQDKVKSNPVLKEYQKAYKRNYAKKMSNRLSEDEFRHWVYNSTVKRDETAEEYSNNPDDQIIEKFKNYLGNK